MTLETLMVIVFQRGRVGDLMKHYVCEVIRIFARWSGLAGPIVSVLALAGEACETLLPIVLHRYSKVGGGHGYDELNSPPTQ